MKVLVESHNPSWAVQFAKVRDDLQSILKEIPILSIEHVGSTAIPDLLAKPILDIDIVVSPHDASAFEAARSALVTAGYTDLGEMGIKDRVGFRQAGNPHWKTAADGPRDGTSWEEEMRRNVYVVLEGSVALKNHRDLKKVLLEDESLTKRYGEVKRVLAEREMESVREYSRGKNSIMLEILEKAGWSENELEEVKKSNG
ncbi:putative UPF0157 protein YqkA [Stipitochalara longipes BDJ]|nr:putative UPF0157 protein YqkA [Stipitochalara longipes BDJ]